MENTRLTKPRFKAGKEKRFSEFIRNIDRKDRVALISHMSDLDGIASAKVVREAVDTNFIKFVDYKDLNDDLIEEIKNFNVTKIIFTDLMIKDAGFFKKIEEFAEILIIDHHPFEVDFNSDKTVFINAKGYCAAYLCYYLFSKIKNIEKLDWLVACACIADFQYFANRKWLQGIYQKYGDEFVVKRRMVMEKGKIWELVNILGLAIAYFKPNSIRVFNSIGKDFGDVGDLEKFSDAVKNELYVVMKKFEIEREEIRDGYFYEFECVFPIKSILINTISKNIRNKTLIIGEKKGDYYSISARRQDKKVDLNALVKKLVEGFENSTAGGHFAAAAADFPINYLDEFKKRLKELQ